MNRYDEIKALLTSHVLEVVFTKVNGEERTMRCTLRYDHLPEANRDIVDGETKQLLNEEISPSAIRVWDLDIGAWRSFRTDSSIKSIKIE